MFSNNIKPMKLSETEFFVYLSGKLFIVTSAISSHNMQQRPIKHAQENTSIVEKHFDTVISLHHCNQYAQISVLKKLFVTAFLSTSLGFFTATMCSGIIRK